MHTGLLYSYKISFIALWYNKTYIFLSHLEFFLPRVEIYLKVMVKIILRDTRNRPDRAGWIDS